MKSHSIFFRARKGREAKRGKKCEHPPHVCFRGDFGWFSWWFWLVFGYYEQPTACMRRAKVVGNCTPGYTLQYFGEENLENCMLAKGKSTCMGSSKERSGPIIQLARLASATYVTLPYRSLRAPCMISVRGWHVGPRVRRTLRTGWESSSDNVSSSWRLASRGSPFRRLENAPQKHEEMAYMS